MDTAVRSFGSTSDQLAQLTSAAADQAHTASQAARDTAAKVTSIAAATEQLSIAMGEMRAQTAASAKMTSDAVSHSQWASTDLRFAIYLPAILATGLLAGIPVAVGAAIVSIFIIFWAFMPPYFEFKWPSEGEQINLLLNAIPYLITVYLAYLCQVVLRRLRRSELNNRVLARELEHRGRNLFSVVEVVVQKTLADNPERANSIIGRLKSIRYSNELLTGKPQSIGIKDLLQQEFAAYGTNRVHMRGPAFDIAPDNARHLILLFHELATNAVKYGSSSNRSGQVFVDWKRDGANIVLSWKEHEGLEVMPPSERGFGNQLVDICIKSLAGTKQEEFAPDGYACTLTFKATTCGAD
jgi:two-component sensor histidine kinase